MINTLRSAFVWFYCLPISDVVWLIILATLIFLFLKSFLEKYSYWKPAINFLLLVWFAIVVYATLINREIGNAAQHNLIPFHSYRAVMNGDNIEILRSNFMNTILFYPAGLMTSALLSRKRNWWKRVLLVLILFSALSSVIEFTQYAFALGKVEIDDVIHNAFGALLGGIFGTVNIKTNK